MGANMEKKPAHKNTLRWEVLLRYQLIEIIALWEGRIITKHLCGAFGIGRQQASKDINAYQANCPNNLTYDKHIKGYIPTSTFKAKYTKGTANEYLHFLNSNKALADVFDKSDMPISHTDVLSVPNRHISPQILRPVIKACRENLRLDITYCSMTSPAGEDRIISPHTLVFSGVRWHVRAYCEKHRAYRDFVINRIKSVDDELGESINDCASDANWHNYVEVNITPNPKLPTEQQNLIARDYAMKDNLLMLKVRSALVQYALDQLHVATSEVGNLATANLVLQNRDELQGLII